MADSTYGRYTLIEKVGQGGMSVVYRAHDPVLDRIVALKLLHPHLAGRAESRARFSREARAVAKLRHNHIVEIFDHAAPDSDRAFIVTEFVDGPTLRDFVEAHPVRQPEVAAMLVLPIAEALGQAHNDGVIHRDVKPENIMIRPDGSPVLMDFGIAQMVDMPTLTATGTMLGSPAHMAPEVIDGKDIGAGADVFSIGTTLYLLVCGSLPFTGPNPSALFRKILETRYDPVLHRKPRAGRAMARLIEDCLLRDPLLRPTAREVARRLKAITDAMGLVDRKRELALFSADPEVYQDELGRRIIAPLQRLAAEAYEQRRIAIALDHIDRILTLDPENSDARKLLHTIEKGQRFGERLKFAAIFASAAIPAAVGGWLWLSMESPPPPTQPASIPPIIVDQGPVPDAAQRVDAMVQDLGAPDATREADSSLQQPALDAEVRAEKAPERRRRSRRRRRAQPTMVKKPDLGVPAPSADQTQATMRLHSAYKGAEVYINDAPHPSRYLYKIEAAGGLILGSGTHRVRIEMTPSCEGETRSVKVAPGQSVLPPFVYRCQPTPAVLLVKASGEPLLIRRSDTNAVIGQTNQKLSIRMKTIKRQLDLTIGTPGGRFAKRTVGLEAGQTRTIDSRL